MVGWVCTRTERQRGLSEMSATSVETVANRCPRHFNVELILDAHLDAAQSTSINTRAGH